MATATAQEALDAYMAGMADARTAAKYRKGIQGYNGNPMAQAATTEALQNYVNRVQESVNSGHRARQLLAANPAVWKQNAVTTGAARLGDGAKKAAAKMLPKLQALQGVWAQQAALKQSIPGKDKASGKQRMNEAFDLMAAAGKNAT